MAEAWNAKWISYAYDPRQDLGVFSFRRVFEFTPPLRECDVSRGGGRGVGCIRVSADNRYKLYCNGRLVGTGPQRGDERHWFYDTYDLAPYMVDGENELVALVWNFGWLAPMAQHTVRTAFVVESLFTPPPNPLPATQDIRGEGEFGLSTPSEWQVARVPGWDFEMMHSGGGEFYIDVGPGEIIEGTGATSPSPDGEGAGGWGNDLPLSPKSLEWRTPHVICQAEDRGATGGGTPWMLIPATLPPQKYELRKQEPARVWIQPSGQILDFGELLCAYPRFFVSGEKGTEVRVTYAESMWIPGTQDKGNRNETEGKELRGYQDKFILSGGDDVFEPLWWRTFRFIEISSTPPPSPLPATQTIRGEGEPGPLVKNIQMYETGYPYAVESSFEADDPWVKPIWDVSVRTAQRCAGETYFDCPYYEQLQYVGDSRIQALIGYYLGKDRRLQRNCIEQIGWSLMENGLTQSRYPSRQTQVIPPFSLWWVMMEYDQWLYDNSESSGMEPQTGIASSVCVAIMQLLRWPFGGEPTPFKFWQFADWVPEWKWGVPPDGENATLHRLTLLLSMLSTNRRFSCTGHQDNLNPALANARREYKDHAKRLVFNGGLVADPEDHSWEPTEHAEALLRCAQMLVGQDPDPWPTEALSAANAAKCTYYFSYYKHLAMFGAPEHRSNTTDRAYMDELQPWKEQIENGLTTFAENPEPTRSDCHAWSAHPILGFFQIVAGVTSIAPAWKKAQIMPHPGDLKRFDANIAHRDGNLQVKYENETFEIDSPVPFNFKWRGLSGEFTPGRHRIG